MVDSNRVQQHNCHARQQVDAGMNSAGLCSKKVESPMRRITVVCQTLVAGVKYL